MFAGDIDRDETGRAVELVEQKPYFQEAPRAEFDQQTILPTSGCHGRHMRLHDREFCPRRIVLVQFSNSVEQ